MSLLVVQLLPEGIIYNLHVTLFPPDGKPPSFDADDENEIRGAAAAAAPLPLDLC